MCLDFIFCTVNDYPPSCWEKIPHFKGCEEASKRLARLSEFKRAQVDTISVIGIVFNVLRIRIRRIRMFLSLLDPEPLVEYEVRIQIQIQLRILLYSSKNRKNLISDFCFVTFIFEKLCKCSFKK
jgi:hypothetical protein